MYGIRVYRSWPASIPPSQPPSLPSANSHRSLHWGSQVHNHSSYQLFAKGQKEDESGPYECFCPRSRRIEVSCTRGLGNTVSLKAMVFEMV